MGKTRLALEVSVDATDRFPAGSAFVSLTALSEPQLVPAVLGEAIDRGLGSQARGSARSLLLIDNFEHLMPAALELLQLLSQHPNLTMLITSRARLRVRPEREVQVPPLDVGPRKLVSAASVGSTPAGQLLLERAREANRAFEISETSAVAVAEICWRVGGLPLALELAAAKLRTLTAPELVGRLATALDEGAARDLPPRQQTLRETVRWSYRLLSPDQQLMFRRVCVFSGGFDLEAAEGLLGTTVGQTQVLPLLEVLVEQSLVTVTHRAGGSHFSLLEPIREYGAALMIDLQEEEQARREHADWFLRAAERTVPSYQGWHQVAWYQRPDWESDNLRAAMHWAITSGSGETAARLGWALWLAWWERGEFAEGRRSMEAALQLGLTPGHEARAHVVLASMCDALGDGDAAAHSWAATLEIAQSQGDRVAEAYGLAGAGLAVMLGDHDLATERLTRALDVATAVSERWLQSLCHIWLGTLHLTEGRVPAALDQCQHGLDSALERGDRLTASVALTTMARAKLAQGLDGQAEGLLTRSIHLSADIGDHVNVTFALDLLAFLESRRSNWHRAAVVLGAARGLRSAHSYQYVRNYYLPDADQQSQTIKDVTESLGDAAFKTAIDTGSAMSLASIAAYVSAPPNSSNEQGCPAARSRAAPRQFKQPGQDSERIVGEARAD